MEMKEEGEKCLISDRVRVMFPKTFLQGRNTVITATHFHNIQAVFTYCLATLQVGAVILTNTLFAGFIHFLANSVS